MRLLTAPGPGRTRVIEVSWRGIDPTATAEPDDIHIPGAVHADLERDFASAGSIGGGRMPLPTEHSLTQTLRSWGISRGDTVVVVDADARRAAARAWWVLRHAGVADTRILNGGLSAWRESRPAVAHVDASDRKGDVTAHYGSMPTIEAADVAAIVQNGVLLDARDGARYRGEYEPVDPRAGHIPGARSAPTLDNLDASGRFLPAENLRRRFARYGALDRPVAVYCGSGVAAAHEVAALAVAGVAAGLYVGSWSQWSHDPNLPIAGGADPIACP